RQGNASALIPPAGQGWLGRSSTPHSLRRPVSAVTRRLTEESMAILLVSRRYTGRTGCDDWPSADAIATRRSSFSEVFRKEDARMTTVEQPGRFTTLPDEEMLAATVVALEEHGFSVEVVDGLDAAREAVLARIPTGSSVMTNTSVTLQEAGIAAAVDEGGRYESARNKMMALDFATQL